MMPSKFNLRLLGLALPAIFLLNACTGGAGTAEPTQEETAPTRTVTQTIPVEDPTPEPTATPPPTEIPPTPMPEPIHAGNIDALSPKMHLAGHDAEVTSVDFSSDGELLASGSVDGTVIIWNLADGSILHKLDGHTEAVNDVAFSPDGSLLLSGSNDMTARLWNVADGSELKVLESRLLGRVLRVSFSPTGLLASLGGHKCAVEMRRMPSGVLYRSLPQPGCVVRDGTVETWGVDFNSTGEQIATGEGRPCCGGSVQLWEVNDFVLPHLVEGYNLKVRDLEIAPDDTTAAVALLQSPIFWHIKLDDGTLLQTFDGHTFRVNSVAFSKDGKTIASGSRDTNIIFWSVDDGTQIRVLSDHTDAVNDVTFSNDGSLMASASDDLSIIVWSLSQQ
jgi:WD40 repeat protein